MRKFALAGLVLAVVAGGVKAQDFQVIPPEQAGEIAKLILTEVEKVPNPPFALKVDAAKTGLLFNEAAGGLMIVPREGLKEGDTTGLQDPTGAPIAYLFLYLVRVSVDGKPADASKVSTVKLNVGDGVDREIAVFRLTLKKESDKEYKLLVFGKDKKPIASCVFRDDKKTSELPVMIEVKDVKDDKGTLIVNLHGKYSADLKIAKAP